jgi:hypothetical protein
MNWYVALDPNRNFHALSGTKHQLMEELMRCPNKPVVRIVVLEFPFPITRECVENLLINLGCKGV